METRGKQKTKKSRDEPGFRYGVSRCRQKPPEGNTRGAPMEEEMRTGDHCYMFFTVD